MPTHTPPRGDSNKGVICISIVQAPYSIKNKNLKSSTGTHYIFVSPSVTRRSFPFKAPKYLRIAFFLILFVTILKLSSSNKLTLHGINGGDKPNNKKFKL